MYNPNDEELELIKDMAKTYQNDFDSYHEAYDYFYKCNEDSYYNSFEDQG